jgi:hypothetical protein
VIDSAGTGGGKSNWYKPGVESYHTGNKADARMTAAAAKRGITLSSRSRPMRYVMTYVTSSNGNVIIKVHNGWTMSCSLRCACCNAIENSDTN